MCGRVMERLKREREKGRERINSTRQSDCHGSAGGDDRQSVAKRRRCCGRVLQHISQVGERRREREKERRGSGLSRNQREPLSLSLSLSFRDHYLIYNLSGVEYDYSKFDHRVVGECARACVCVCSCVCVCVCVCV